MELIVLTEIEAAENTGEYMPFHEILPIFIETDMYILKRELCNTVGLEEYKDAILLQPFFEVGDGSDFDIKYQAYLVRTEEELLT